MASNKKITEIFMKWNKGKVVDIEEIQSNVHRITVDTGKKYILKKKKESQDTEKEYKLMSALYENGVPVPLPEVNKCGAYYVNEEGSDYILYPYIEGQVGRKHYEEEGLEYVTAYGEAIAKLHNGLNKCEFIKEYTERNFIDEVSEWAMPIIGEKLNNNSIEKLEEILQELNEFREEYKTLPSHLIHRDMHPGNMVLENKKVKAFLDFEISIKGVRIFDICYCSTGILMEVIDDLEKRNKWLKVLGNLVEGYESVDMLSDTEREGMWYIMMCIQLICAAYFYEINNSEVAEKNIEALMWIHDNHEEIYNSILRSCIKLNMEEMGQFFDNRADGYDEHMRGTVVDFEVYYKMLAQPVQETNSNISILDLGCGTGLELEGIFEKAHNAHITGIDMSEDMMKKLSERYKEFQTQINLIKGSYLQVPFGEEKYDYAVSSMTMHHFVPEKKVELYKNIRKSIKKGGIYIEGDYAVSEKNAKLYLDRYYEIMESLEEDKRGLYHLDIPFSVETQKELFLKAGFSDVKVIWKKGLAAIFVAQV